MKKVKKEIVKDAFVIESSMEDIFSDRFDRYAREIIPDRALPDVRDGLKPVQRRILYAMYKDGNTSNKPYRKSAKTVGLVIGNYHPHGDSSVYEAMVRLSQNWKMRETLIDMHGNNGSIDDDPAAAMRYTEARLSPISALLLKDIDQKTVNFALNFDDTEEEPTVLPASYPNILVNGSIGVAIGYATNMPPHNLNEVVDATIYRINHPDCTLNDLMHIIKGPDFPTGGIIQGKEGIVNIYQKGQGHFVIRSKTEIVETKTVNQIHITEIPYDVIKSKLVSEIDEVRLSKDTQGILDVRDESDRSGLKIVVDIKKEYDPNTILNYLFKKTSLQISYNANMTVIVNKQPRLLGLIDLLDAYIEHRRDVTIRRCKYQLDKIEARCHILEGLMKAVSVMDEVISIIRKSKDKADSKKNLIKAFDFSEVQAEAIVTLQLYRLSNTDIVELKEEYAKLLSLMDVLKGVLSNEAILRQLLVKELKQVNTEFVRERKTEIQDDVEEIVIDKHSMMVNERVMITISRDGYLKRTSLRSYNASEAALTGIKEGDQLIGYLEVDSLDKLLLITESGNYLVVYVYELDEGKWKDIGTHISNISNVTGNEKILKGYIVKDFKTDAHIITLSEQGMIKKTAFSLLEPQRYNRLYNLMGLKKNDKVVHAEVIYEEDSLLLATKSGNSAMYQSNQVPSTSLKAQGVKAMNLAVGDLMADFTLVNSKRQHIVVINHEGSMKRLKVSDFSFSNRPVKGEGLYKKVKSHPLMVRYLLCNSMYDEIKFISDKEEIILCKDITLMNKDATFSNSIVLDNKSYLYKGIEEVKVIDIVEREENPSGNIRSEEGTPEYEILSFDV